MANLFTPTTQGFQTNMAADPATHRLFMGRTLFIDQSVFPPVTAQEILTIDLVNGGIKAESPLLTHPVGSLLFDTNGGVLLGMTTDSSPSELVQIDLTSGAEADLASIPGDGFGPFAFAPALHKAYVMSITFGVFPNIAQLFTVDTNSHAVTPGPVLNPGGRNLVYDTSSNQLFMITFNLTPFSAARFVRLDPNTGAETPLGTYDFGFFLEPGIAIDSNSHTVFVTQDVFDPFTGPVTHIASISDIDGSGTLGPSMGLTMGGLVFVAPSITAESIKADVRSALASGTIDNAGVAASLLAELNAAGDARARGQCTSAASIYQAFVNDLTAQSGQHVAPATASQLISEAQFLIANCP